MDRDQQEHHRLLRAPAGHRKCDQKYASHPAGRWCCARYLGVCNALPASSWKDFLEGRGISEFMRVRFVFPPDFIKRALSITFRKPPKCVFCAVFSSHHRQS